MVITVLAAAAAAAGHFSSLHQKQFLFLILQQPSSKVVDDDESQLAYLLACLYTHDHFCSLFALHSLSMRPKMRQIKFGGLSFSFIAADSVVIFADNV